MRFAELVDASDAVAATRSRTAKVATLAAVFGRLAPEEVEAAVGLAAGDPRQRRIGIGWSTVAGVSAPPADVSTVTILELDAALSDLAAFAGERSASLRTAALTSLLSRMTAAEAEHLRRLLTGGVRQGALAGIVAEAVAVAAAVTPASLRRAAMLAGDLGAAARVALTEGDGGLAAIGLVVLRAVQPMLAATSPDVVDAIAAAGLSSVEWKLDGARIQAHRLGDEVRLFTRNLNDVTARLPAVAAIVRGLPAHSVILDGEVLGFAPDERPDAFQDTMSRFGRGSGQLTVVFFDCLHRDGEDLIDRPLGERIAALAAVAAGYQVPSMTTSDPEVAAAFTAAALEAGHEGVMVKAIGSTYEAGRRGQAWRKVKPVHTLDLVVLGAEWGHGRRKGWLSNLHLGAADPSHPGNFVMVGKTFKGMTDEMLRWQTDRLSALATAALADFVVPVRPELVVEVAVDGVQRSTRYPGGVALRFARVRRYREDKDAAGADTIDDVRGLLPTDRRS